MQKSAILLLALLLATQLLIAQSGQLDPSFADQGEYRYSNPLFTDLAYHIEVLEDGKILGAGAHGTTNANPDLLLIQLNPDGSPDTTFGTDGITIQPIDSGEDYIFSFAVNDVGQIITGGTSHLPSSSYRKHLVCRFNANGTLDSTFAENGIFTWGPDETSNDILDITIAEDGGIFACGKSVPAGTDRMSLYKIREDGSSLDSTFATDGGLLLPFEGEARGMIIHSNGNILLTGSIPSFNGSDIVYIDFSIDAPSIEFIELHDYTGKKIGGITTQLSDDKIAVNLSALPQGLFLLTIHTVDGLVVKRMLKI